MSDFVLWVLILIIGQYAAVKSIHRPSPRMLLLHLAKQHGQWIKSIIAGYVSYLSTALDQATTATVSCRCTTAVVFSSVLSILLVLFLVVFTIVIVNIVLIRRKKQAQTEIDVYYDTINVSYHSTPTSVIETEINAAYGHIKSTWNYLHVPNAQMCHIIVLDSTTDLKNSFLKIFTMLHCPDQLSQTHSVGS